MPVNWQDKAVQDRLLTAFIASNDNKVNVAEIARLCGGDMTYHAVENYLRKFRREAKVMKGQAPAATSSPVKPTATPRKPRNSSPTKETGVKSGRVEKKKPAAPKVKKEVVEEELDEMLFGGGVGEEEEELQSEI